MPSLLVLASRSPTLPGLFLALLLTTASAASAQVAPAQPDSTGLREAPSIRRLVAGGLIGGAVGTLAPLLLIRGCGTPEPPDLECSGLPRDLVAGLGYVVGVPIGAHVAGGRRASPWRPLLGSLMASGMVGLFAYGWESSIAYAIPAVHLVVSVAAAR